MPRLPGRFDPFAVVTPAAAVDARPASPTVGVLDLLAQLLAPAAPPKAGPNYAEAAARLLRSTRISWRRTGDIQVDKIGEDNGFGVDEGMVKTRELPPDRNTIYPDEMVTPGSFPENI
jgi:hypothetical protein